MSANRENIEAWVLGSIGLVRGIGEIIFTDAKYIAAARIANVMAKHLNPEGRSPQEMLDEQLAIDYPHASIQIYTTPTNDEREAA
jgi:hypothetical protein